MKKPTQKPQQSVDIEHNFTFESIVHSENPDRILSQAKPFVTLMMQYRCAMMEIETKLKVLNAEFSINNNLNPIETIKTRVKEPMSILEKLQRKGLPLTIQSIEENLNDVAGIRVICSFPEDIYTVRDLIVKQDDVTLIEEKDYIKNPKPNGYRSLHLILEVPIFLAEEKKPMRVELQLRTIAMDFWASLDHKMKYKKDVENADEIVAKLRHCALVSNELDYQMQEIRNQIDGKQM